jgi:uncharacterized protein
MKTNGSRLKALIMVVAIFAAGVNFGVRAFANSPARPFPPEQTAPKPVETKPAGLPASMAGYADEGAYALYLNEDALGDFSFKWEIGGRYTGTSTIRMAGQSITLKLDIETDAAGLWTKIVYNTPQAVIQITRDGTRATRTVKDKTDTFEIRPGTVLFENYSPAFIGMTIRAYDNAKGGKQTVPVFIIPAAIVDVRIESMGTEERNIGGKDVRFRKFLYGFPGVDMTVWVDEKDKPCLAEVPVQKAAFVRRGYEILMTKAAEDPLLSTPKFDVIAEANVRVPMRDNVRLATDIYRPKADGGFPVILIRTPYKKDMAELEARAFARRGYVCAVQDCRGRFGSEGIWEPFVDEPRDGYDSIEWLAARPWSNGKVGMIGGSYVGWVQWWAAREKPPHLVTIVPNVSPPDPFYNLPYEYGAFFMWGAIWWADILESNATADLSGAAMSKISEKKYQVLLKTLPVIDLDKKILGKINPYWRKWIAHPTDDAYWERASFLEKLKDVRIPAFHQSGWFDGDGIGTKLNFLKMASFGHPGQKMIVGPWGHTDTAARGIGDLDFGPQALVDLKRDYLRWFDFWLKGVDNGIMKEPKVKLFVMGTNKWIEDDVYPVSCTRFEKWYLSGDGKANTSKGGGLLTARVPAKGSPPDAFVYDPGDPTPSPEFYEETEADSKRARSQEEKTREAKAFHESITSARPDILVYQTGVLEKPLTFAGPLSAVLYASSSAKDTDWFMRLVWIQKNGDAFQLAEGKIRARFRNSMKKPEPIEPGKIYEYSIDLWQTGITIPAGDRLRVEVASASFPLFSRNLNTGGHNETETAFVKADQKVYHNDLYPSHILLPIIPEDRLK